MATIFEVTSFDPGAFEAAVRLTAQLAPHAVPLTQDDFEAMVRAPETHLFMLRDDGVEIAGMATVGVYKTPTGQKAWIEDVVIDERFRGRGYGRMIVQHLLRFAKSHRIPAVMLTSSPIRVAANELYRSLGFARRETNVYKYVTEK